MRKKERIEALEKKLEVLLDYLKLEVSENWGTFEIRTKPEPEPQPEPEPEPRPDPTRQIRAMIGILEARPLESQSSKDLHNELSAELAKRNRLPIEPPQREGKNFKKST